MVGTYPNPSQAKNIFIDIETKDPFLQTKGVSYIYGEGYILGVGIKLDNEPTNYYPLKHQNEINCDAEQFSKYLFDLPSTANVIGHYYNYDAGWLFSQFNWLHKGNYRDTLLMAQIERNNRFSYSLKNLSKEYGLGNKGELDATRIWTMPIEAVAKYCCQDVDLTAKLYYKIYKTEFEEQYDRECNIIPVLVQMKANGIDIDMEQLDGIQLVYESDLKKQMRFIPEIKSVWDVSQLLDLFNKLGIEILKIDNKPSFPAWYLEGIQHPKIVAVAKARHIDRLIKFCHGIRESIGVDGKIHPDFFNGRSDYGGTITGRFSSANPNVQQIPHRTDEGKLLRSVFIASNSWHKFDYSQQEPRLMMHYANLLGCQGIQAWLEKYQLANSDFYTPIQEMMKIDRFPAKTITLARCYNMGPGKLANVMHIPLEEAKNYLFSFNRVVPWLTELKMFCEAKALERKWIKTLGGRYLYFNRNFSDAFNHLIQGSAADQIKQAMLNIYRVMGLVPLLQVHDELGYSNVEQNDSIEIIKQEMEDAFKLSIPSQVDYSVGKNWMECG